MTMRRYVTKMSLPSSQKRKTGAIRKQARTLKFKPSKVSTKLSALRLKKTFLNSARYHFFSSYFFGKVRAHSFMSTIEMGMNFERERPRFKGGLKIRCDFKQRLSHERL